MNICSDALDLVKKWEGYGQALKDGSGRCTAYQEVINGKRDIPTIGWGCTKNVKMGDVWTRDQAESALLKELSKHAERVTRLVTIELNANEYGALVSFDYNTGGLTDHKTGRATNTLKTINKGDRHKIVEALRQWNKFGGKVSKGLVSRRAAEIALFLKPVEEPEPDFMPQEPDAPGMSTAGKASALTVGGTTGLIGSSALLGDPVGLTSTLVSVKGNAVQLLPSGINFGGLIVPLLILAIAIGAAIFLTRGKE